MNEPLPDDLFRNRISAALRELAQPESNADLEEALDAAEAEPLDERAAARILASVHESIAAERAGGPAGKSPPSAAGRAPIASHSQSASRQGESPRHEGNGRTRPESGNVEVRRASHAEVPRESSGFWGVLVSCAALVAATFGVLVNIDRSPSFVTNRTESRHSTSLQLALRGTPRRASYELASAAPTRVEAGQTIVTGPREKRRVTLPDGSILSINEASRVHVKSARRVELERGEVFVEVVPVANTSHDGQAAPAERFVVDTPRRSVTALGTKFVVQAQPHETHVVVTQGKVQVSGVKTALPAGQELTIDDDGAVDVRPAKRTSYIVDWVKDLVAASASFVPPSAHAGGSITVVDPQGQEMKLSLRKFHVDVHIEDGFARTTIDQTYFNHTWQQLEGTFRFPLPADASLSRLAMYVNGTLMEGGMVERDHGRNVFEQIRHTRRDPALLEWVDGTTFQMRVFPLEARQEKRIILSYSQRLPLDYGKSVYRFPGGHDLDGVRLWSTEVRVKGAAGRKWHSPSHLLESRQDGGDLVLAGREEHALLDRDLVVELDETSAVEGKAKPAGDSAPRWSVYEQDGFRYVMLRYRPTLEATGQRMPRHWIFLVEHSGDRDSLTAATQRQIVKTWLENVEHGDTLSLVRASTEASLFRGSPVPCSIENAAAALNFLDEQPPLGALDLGQALDAVRPLARRDRETWIVHLGTGVPVLGERDTNSLLRRLPEHARYLGVAVGKRWSKPFLETAAARTGGAVVQINPDEPVVWKTFETLGQLNAPRLTQIAVTTADGAASEFQMFARQIAHGQELGAVGRFAADKPLPRSLRIVGRLNGRAYSQEVIVPASLGESLDQLRLKQKSKEGANVAAEAAPSDTAAPTIAGHLPRTWARQEIDRLSALGLTEHRAEIIQLSKSMYVMSPFTSLLVLETEAMYAQFNVDRGRKDHWALYPAPATLPPAAVEPGPQPATPLDAAQQRLAELQTRLKSAVAQRDRAAAEKRPAADVARLERLTRVEQREIKRLADEVERMQREQQEADDPAVKAWKSVVDRSPIWIGASDAYARHWAWGRRQLDDFRMPDEKFLLDLYGLDFRQTRSDLYLLPQASDLTDLGYEYKLRSRLSIVTNGIDELTVEDELRRRHAGWDFDYESDGWSRLSELPELFKQRGVSRGIRVVRGTPVYRGFNEEIDDRYLSLLGENYLGNASRLGVDFSNTTLYRRPRTSIPWYYSNGLDSTTWSVEQNEQALLSGLRSTSSLPILLASSFGERASNESGVSKFVLERRNHLGWADFGTNLAFETEFETYIHPQLAYFGGGRGTQGAGFGGGPPDRYILTDGRVRLARLLQFGTPLFGGLIRDLPSYAPGLRTWEADRLAVVEQALPEARRPTRGRVDDQARRIVEQARALGWRKFRAVATKGRPAGHWIQANGAGQFAYQRETLDGLVEQVVCDGRTLWQLYAELGLGAKRAVSRFHQPALQGLLPGYVPSIDDLSVGADVTVAGERTIRIAPREERKSEPGADAPNRDVAQELKKEGEKTASQPAAKRVVPVAELEFGADGRLVEIRVVDRESGRLLAKQTYSADGTVRRFDGAGKLLAEQRFESEPCEAPQLAPDVRELVVLPLPFRSVDATPVSVTVDLQKNAPDYAKLTDDEALLLTATYFAAARPQELNALFDARFKARGDKRVGFAVLLSALQHNHPSVVNAQTQYPDATISQYLTQADAWVWAGSPNGTLDGGPHATKFVRNLCGIYNHLSRWISDRGVNKERPASDVTNDLNETIKFVKEQRSPIVTLGLLDAVHAAFERHGRWTPDWAKQLQDAAESVATERDWPQFAAALRVRWWLAAGDDASRKQAEEFYAKQLCDVVAAGRIPVADASLREAFVRSLKQTNDQPCAPWGRAIRRAAEELAAKVSDADGMTRRIGLLELARQCGAVSEKQLAAEIAELATRGQDLSGERSLNLAVLRYAQTAGDWKLAEACFQRVFADAELVQQASVWRDAAHTAIMQQNPRDWARRMQRALQIEYEALPPTVDIAAFRVDYANVLGQLDRSVAHVKEAKLPGREELLALLDDMAYQWRELDPEETTACHRLAESYAKTGQAKRAWDYWTTPLSASPDQGATWQQFASQMQQQGRFVDADRAWSTAFELEPTNADILMAHAEFLWSQKQASRARDAWRRIAEGTWQPRFDPTKQRAVQRLAETK